MSVSEDQPVIEASLGGHVDLLEMKTFAEELEECFEDLAGEAFYLVLDYSKAKTFDAATHIELNEIKDMAHNYGATKVFSVPQEGSGIEDHVTTRMQDVLEGKEEFLAFAYQADFAPLPVQRMARAA